VTILRTLATLALAWASLNVFAGTASRNAYDFNYNVSSTGQRPMIVFNDGENTYIQPPPGAKATVSTASQQQGPYLVVPGLPQFITGSFAIGKSVSTFDIRRTGGALAPVASGKAKSEEKLILEIGAGEMVSTAIGRFLRSNGFDLDWMGDDFRAKSKLVFEGDSAKDVFAKAVAKLNLPAMWLTDANRAVVSESIRTLNH
jgi:hypothetical protein